MYTVNCPQCGARLIKEQEDQKIIICVHCLSSFIIENIAKLKHSIMLKTKSIQIKSMTYHLLEANQMQYDQGICTEWLIKNTQNELFYFTEDDENFSLTSSSLTKLENNNSLNWNYLQPNTRINLFNEDWLVTEKREFHIADTHPLKQTYLTGENAQLLVLQFFDTANGIPLIKYRRGIWLDPFEIRSI
jgi:hypothetical protein